MAKDRLNFPSNSNSAESLLSALKNLKASDLDWKRGRSFSYVYYAEDDILDVLKSAYTTYFSENALNPSAFPSLRKMEQEVVQMCLDLFNGSEEGVGSMTSGGTESILMAVKSAKEYAKIHKPDISHPEIIVPQSVHPAFNKACDYFSIKSVTVPVGENYKVDVSEIEKAISKDTIMIVASAPQYPQGVVDPIKAIGALAIKYNLLFHVDACVGGFVLPFLKDDIRLDFDLSVAGVTSLSADIHKYGYASKGCSVVLYNDPALRKAQFYVYADWPGGIYASPSILGTRAGGSIAVAWTVLQYLGRSRYEQLVEKKMRLTRQFMSFIESFEELEVVGRPEMCIFSFTSERINVYELGDEMYLKGWLMDRQQNPPSLHLSISPNHEHYIEDFKEDFKASMTKVRGLSAHKVSNAAQRVINKGMHKILPDKAYKKIQQAVISRSNPEDKRSAAMYGMIGDLRGSGDLDSMVRAYLDKLLS